MKGYVYIFKMRHEGKSYYKIGRTLNLGSRERGANIDNPFSSIIAVKQSTNYQKEEKTIHTMLKPYHYSGEWFVLDDDQYLNLQNQFNFLEYTEEDRARNKKLAIGLNRKKNEFCVFKRYQKSRNGKTVRRWYYCYINDEGKQVKKVCKGCITRTDAENYIRNIQEEKTL